MHRPSLELFEICPMAECKNYSMPGSESGLVKRRFFLEASSVLLVRVLPRTCKRRHLGQITREICDSLTGG